MLNSPTNSHPNPRTLQRLNQKPNMKTVDNMMKQLHHTHQLKPSQCGSCLTQTIDAPLDLVWSMIRSFDEPQVYKRFIGSCCMLQGDGGVGSIREVHLVSGLPAESSIERLEFLDDEMHVMSFSILGGDHCLVNYKSTITLHDDGKSTVVTESYVVDVPDGNTEEDTKLFTDTIIRCNLKSLAEITESIKNVWES